MNAFRVNVNVEVFNANNELVDILGSDVLSNEAMYQIIESVQEYLKGVSI